MPYEANYEMNWKKDYGSLTYITTNAIVLKNECLFCCWGWVA